MITGLDFNLYPKIMDLSDMIISAIHFILLKEYAKTIEYIYHVS